MTLSYDFILMFRDLKQVVMKRYKQLFFKYFEK